MTEIIALSAATIGGEEIQTVNARDLHAVSYTHLTLPTKRIV